jgi:methionine-rich copper-binding protein CopC
MSVHFPFNRFDHESIMKTAFFARGLVAAFALVLAQFAYAHAHPKQQTPAAGATVAAPHEVAIVFDDALEPAFSSIDVTDAHGQSVAAAKSAVDAANHKRMTVALRDLAPGPYSVAWIALAADGHRTQGRYTFTVK